MADGLHQKTNETEIVRPEMPEVTPEKKGEQRVVPTSEKDIHGEHETPLPSITPRPSQAKQAAPQKSPLRQEIENVLEEDLVELYRSLTPRQKQQFKETGERTAAHIEKLLRKVRITVIEIIRLIRRWLILLPGVNIFFVEKEAKIKAERILALKDRDSTHE